MGKSCDSIKRSEISWKFDFTDCGLVIQNFRVKGRSSDDEDIDWRVIGDERVGCRPILSGEWCVCVCVCVCVRERERDRVCVCE